MAHLLLIDDDPDLLAEKVRHFFPAPEHRVEVAYTGSEALKCIGAAPPDVIILDLRLPDQSGLEILRQLRRIDARVPVIMVTVVRSTDSVGWHALSLRRACGANSCCPPTPFEDSGRA